MNKEIIIVGSGLSGSIMARSFAENGFNVRIIERRNHIAGNLYEFYENEIRMQKYGPHIFHTNIEEVYSFLTKYCNLKDYELKCQAVIDGISTPTPFNFKTIDQFYDEEKAEFLKNKLLTYYKRESATVLEMLNCDDSDIREYAEFLFDKDYSKYTAKQWGKKPEEVDPLILRRVPIVFNYNENYFFDKYEGIPENGYTDFIENVLNHNNISIELNQDALEHIYIDFENKQILFDGKKVPVIFTGAIDELFEYRYGKLPYRSLYFEYEFLETKDFQVAPVVAYPENAEFTRITEYTKLPKQNVGNKTVIAKEFSVEYDKNNEKGNEPYYPVLTEESNNIYQKYRAFAENFDNLVLCGRLADFKYYNMDLAIDRALKCFEEVKNKF